MFFAELSNIFPYAEIILFGILLFAAIFVSASYATQRLGKDNKASAKICIAIIALSICSVLFGHAFAIQSQTTTNLEKAVTAWCNTDINSVKACNTVCYMLGGKYEITKTTEIQETTMTWGKPAANESEKVLLPKERTCETCADGCNICCCNADGTNCTTTEIYCSAD